MCKFSCSYSYVSYLQLIEANFYDEVYLFQNYNFDDHKIWDRQSLKFPLPSGLQSQ